MPDLVVSNEGEVELLDLAVRRTETASRGWTLNLYQNDVTPNRDTVLAAFVESTFPSYLPVDLIDSLWQPPFSSSGIARTQYTPDPVVWTPGSDTGEPVYGFFLTFAGGTKLLWSQRLDAAVVPTTLVPVTLLLLFAARSESQPPP